MSDQMYKYSGTGNTFLINFKNKIKETNYKKLAKEVCDPQLGFCADGMLLLSPESDGLRWTFFNSDGSDAEMCGNAARCAFQFCKSQQSELKKIKFFTGAGVVEVEEQKGLISVLMPLYSINRKEYNLQELCSKFSLSNEFIRSVNKEKVLFINTGVPHLIIEMNPDAELREFKEDSSKLRKANIFENGSNVTLINFIEEQTFAVTFERGIEDFTLSCGTGAVAAAIYSSEKKNKEILNIKMPGGELQVDLSEKRPKLIGPVDFIGKVEFDRKI